MAAVAALRAVRDGRAIDGAVSRVLDKELSKYLSFGPRTHAEVPLDRPDLLQGGSIGLELLRCRGRGCQQSVEPTG